MTSGQQLALDVRIAQGMEKKGESIEALEVITNVGDNTSWFRDTPHYWAQASLPLAYAVACVEVVCKSSEKARIKPDVIEADSYLLTTARTSAALFRCRYSYTEGKGYAWSGDYLTGNSLP